jgi:hypothetical protein
MLGVLVLLVTLLLAPAAADAFNPQPEPPAFGMIGIAPGQTARLNVARVHPPDPGLPPGPCRVGLGFVDAEGGLLLPAVQVTLRPGQAAFADIALGRGAVGAGGRMQIRAVFVPPIDPDRPGASRRLARECRDVVATLEVFDTESQQTQVILSPGVIRGFNPQPEPPAATVPPVDPE